MLLAAALAAFVLASLMMTPQYHVWAQGAAAQKSGSSSSTNLTATFYDYDSLGGTLQLLRSDDYNGSGQATYAASSSKNSTLITGFNADGGWNFNLAHQTLRTVYVTPNAAIDNVQPTGPPAGYYGDAVINSGCFDQSGNVVPLKNVVTSSGNCYLGVNFSSAGTSYKLLMSPFPLSLADAPAACPTGGCPSPGLVTVTCNAVSGGQCVSWTIEPNSTGPQANIANLYRRSSTPRPAGSWVFIGQYYNSFRIGLTNP
jgi:hypothetical protein